jgi:hypothetical protein
VQRAQAASSPSHVARRGPSSPASPSWREVCSGSSHATSCTWQAFFPASARRMVCPATPETAAGTALTQSELEAYILGGPLLGVCGISAAAVRRDMALWEQYGRQLAKQLGFTHDSMNDVQK